MRFLLSIFAALLVASPGWGETCTSNSSFDWSVVTGGDWTGAPCTASADDDFVIADGHTVTITGDITLTDDGEIVVNDGGTLTAIVDDTSDVITVTLGNGAGDTEALTCDGKCILNGAYQDFGDSGGGLEATQSSTEFFQAGEFMPCPVVDAVPANDVVEPACGTNPNEIRFIYNLTGWDAASGETGDTHINTFINAIETAGANTRIWAPFDPVPTTPWAPLSVNDAYWITDANDAPTVGGTGNASYAYVEIDVRQQSVNDPSNSTDGSPVAERQIAQANLEVTVEAGDRQVCVASGTVSADDERFGQWVYFQQDTELIGDNDDTPALVHQRPYIISAVEDDGSYDANCASAGTLDSGATDDCCLALDDGADRITLADEQGARRDFEGGSTACGGGYCSVFLTRSGHQKYDPIAIWAPVIIRSSTTGRASAGVEEDSATAIQGSNQDHDIMAVVWDGTGRVSAGDVSDFSIARWLDVWGTDLASSAHVQFRLGGSTTDNSQIYGRTIITGGNDLSGTTAEAGVVQEGVMGSNSLTFNDFTIKDKEGSAWTPSGSGGSPRYTINRLRVQHAADGGAIVINHTGAASSTLTVNDALIVESNPSSNLISAPQAAPRCRGTHNRLMVAGSAGTISNNEFACFNDLTVVGVTTNTALDVIPGGDVNRAVIRDFLNAGATNFWDVFNVDPDTEWTLPIFKNVLLNRVTLTSGTPLFVTRNAGAIVENVASINTDMVVNGHFLSGAGTPTVSSRVKDVTILWTDDFVETISGAEDGINAIGGASATWTVDGVLVMNAAGEEIGGLEASWNLINVGDICAWDDDAEPLDSGPRNAWTVAGGSCTGSNCPDNQSTIRNPAIVHDPLGGVFEAAPGSNQTTVSCGADETAGVTTKTWAHFLTLLEPENAGTVLGSSVSGCAEWGGCRWP